MIKTSVEKLAKDIGFDIGMSDDVTQQNLINGFSEAICKFSERDFNGQLCYISQGLSEKSKKVIQLLAEYCK